MKNQFSSTAFRMTKSLSFILILYCLTATCALADSDWTGFYAGASIGALSGEANPSVVTIADSYFTPIRDAAQLDPAASQEIDGQNMSGSLFFGGDYQINSVVLGLEATIMYSSFSEEESFSDIYDTNGDPFSLSSTFETDWMMSLAPRVGYAYKNSLFYVMGGVALSKFSYEFSFKDPVEQTRLDESETSWGWTVGAGYEYQISDGWGVKAEYAYYKFDDIFDVSSRLATNTLDGFNHKVDFQADSFRLGLVKRF
ncbi:outer membrane protein [Desulfoluna spongiiphila]|uniref:outer membrane protein n=1 Tax=Desulfoluna spongiiphila TaxID=419481 RepID=UPI0012521979|nr:outer membrane beta-barrel protein [Desulfoluna spongiiphila]VVS92608.1 outer membrane protein beta-barrel [Desulfoluna spongiiphila]